MNLTKMRMLRAAELSQSKNELERNQERVKERLQELEQLKNDYEKIIAEVKEYRDKYYQLIVDLQLEAETLRNKE